MFLLFFFCFVLLCFLFFFALLWFLLFYSMLCFIFINYYILRFYFLFWYYTLYYYYYYYYLLIWYHRWKYGTSNIAFVPPPFLTSKNDIIYLFIACFVLFCFALLFFLLLCHDFCCFILCFALFDKLLYLTVLFWYYILYYYYLFICLLIWHYRCKYVTSNIAFILFFSFLFWPLNNDNVFEQLPEFFCQSLFLKFYFFLYSFWNTILFIINYIIRNLIQTLDNSQNLKIS